MAFKPLRKEDGKTITLGAENATVVTKFCGVKINTTGYAIVAEEKRIGATDGEALLCLRVDPSIQIEADTSVAASAANVGDFIDLLNSTHLIIANSTDDAFLVTNLVPSCNTKVRGYFLPAIAGR